MYTFQAIWAQYKNMGNTYEQNYAYIPLAVEIIISWKKLKSVFFLERKTWNKQERYLCDEDGIIVLGITKATTVVNIAVAAVRTNNKK